VVTLNFERDDYM